MSRTMYSESTSWNSLQNCARGVVRGKVTFVAVPAQRDQLEHRVRHQDQRDHVVPQVDVEVLHPRLPVVEQAQHYRVEEDREHHERTVLLAPQQRKAKICEPRLGRVRVLELHLLDELRDLDELLLILRQVRVLDLQLLHLEVHVQHSREQPQQDQRPNEDVQYKEDVALVHADKRRRPLNL